VTNINTTYVFNTLEIARNANIGGWDRVLRIVVGLALIALAATGAVGW